jgi:hypothetical protein
MTATHDHYQKLLGHSKYKPRPHDSSKATYGSSVKVLQHANLGAVIDSAMDRVIYDTFLTAFPLVDLWSSRGLIDTHIGFQGPSCIIYR